MLYARAADLVVVLHVAFIAFALLGGYAAWRWPRLVWVHVPAVATIGLLFAFGADCPLTDLEKYLRRQAGDAVYRDGFVAHYLLPGVPDGVRGVVLPIVVVTVTGIAYAGVVRRVPPSGPARAAGGTRRRESATTMHRSRGARPAS
jgi:Protein of Unknown function (DUF2784)